MDVEHYDRVTRDLHWITALLVVILWLIGQFADDIPDGPLNGFVWSCHVTFGFGLAAILGCRVAWRASRGRGLPAADRGAVHVLAKATHYGLYALLVVIAALGIANAFIRGYDMFGLFHLPRIGDPALKRPVTQWHGLAADAVMILALFHAGAASMHQFVWRDRLISRMLPPGRRVNRS